MKKLAAFMLAVMIVFGMFNGSFAFNSLKSTECDNALAKFNSKEISCEEILNDGSIIDEDFESGSFSTGWWTCDNDGDGNNWAPYSDNTFCYDGAGCAISRSYYDGVAYNTDNWLITPDFTPAITTYLSFYIKSQNPSYPDNLQVLIAAKGSGAYNLAQAFVVEEKWTTILPQTVIYGDYIQFNIDLSDYAGSIIAVAFRHQCCDEDVICLDKVQVGNSEPTAHSGKCGANLFWTLNPGTGVLEITGTGDMYNWNSCTSVPWDSYRMSIKNIQLGNGVTDIGNYAFQYCALLVSVFCGNSVTGIGDYAFSSCSSLTSVIIPDSVTNIGGYAFSSCSSLTSVIIPDSVTSIGDSAFRYCTSLVAAGFLGAPPSSFGLKVFYNCASGFCIYYTATHASEWASNGEITWKGYPIKHLTNSDYCLAKFYSSVFDSAYATFLVKKGACPTLPPNPVMPGHRFAGWYTNFLCLGVPFCNCSNSFMGTPITHNTNFYAKWEAIDLSTDWYSFTNTDSSFYSSVSRPAHRELISGEYYLAYINAMNEGLELILGENTEYRISEAEINNTLNRSWEGCCFGMSVVAILIAAHRLNAGFFQNNCGRIREINNPVNDRTIQNLLEYYLLLQYTPTVHTAISGFYGRSQTENCKSIIASLQSSNYPVLLGFDIKNANGVVIGGHTVVACGYTIIGNVYRINIADPNFTEGYVHLDIEKNTFNNLGFVDALYDDYGFNSFITYNLTMEDNKFNYLNIQNYLTGKGYTSGAAARDIADEEVYTTFTTNFDCFRIDGPNGEYAVIEYGEQTEGDLDIGSGQCMNDIGSELQLEFTVPVLGAGESYTVTPSECLSVVTEEPLEEYHASLVCSGENGFWADSTAGSGAEFVFGSDGSVSTTCTEPCAQSATVCRNDMTTDWSCVTVDSAETATLTAVPTSDSAAIIADPDAEYDITVSSFHNDAVFEGVTGGALGVTVTEDEHKNAVITYNSNSAVAASGVFGCSLIFCTMGGSEIETQTGIAPGTTAAAPYDPTRTGMLFGGWYTTYGCEEGTEWSFDTPLTEDTYIYAKWEEDEDYIHSVTFHIEDGFDTIYYVYNGEALTDYELPEIPEIEGYTASWPEIDLSCIMEDIVIEPIYAPEPTLTPGDVDGDGLVTMADVTLLSMYLNGENPQITEPGMANADANEDGTVDIRDIAAIYAIIAAS